MSACDHWDGFSHCTECCDEQTSAAYRLIGEQKERITELEQTLARFEDATEIRPPVLGELTPEDHAQAYTAAWLEGKVKQLQAREQMIHELGRGYAAIKLKNRELEARAAQLTEALALAKKFMRHHPACDLIADYGGVLVIERVADCSCGHTAAMEKVVLALPRPTVVIECGEKKQ